MAARIFSALQTFARYNRGKQLIELISLRFTLQLSCIHSTSVVLRGKRKVKEPRVSKLAQLREAGKSEEEVQAFIDAILAKKAATQAYLAKLENVAEVFRNEFSMEEERRKNVEGEQMKKEAEEREMQAKNMAIVLKSNEDLSRERYLQK